jgi:hypothetical protein
MTDDVIGAAIMKRVEAVVVKSPKRTRRVAAATKVLAKTNGNGAEAKPAAEHLAADQAERGQGLPGQRRLHPAPRPCLRRQGPLRRVS